MTRSSIRGSSRSPYPPSCSCAERRLALRSRAALRASSGLAALRRLGLVLVTMHQVRGADTQEVEGHPGDGEDTLVDDVGGGGDDRRDDEDDDHRPAELAPE